MTTLTIPGAVPEGLPGTDAQRPKGPRPGQAQHGAGRGNGPNGQQNRGNGPGGGQGKKRGRGNRHRNGPRPDAAPADEAPRVPVPVIVDDDIGNR
jgi:hypothetical protein